MANGLHNRWYNLVNRCVFLRDYSFPSKYTEGRVYYAKKGDVVTLVWVSGAVSNIRLSNGGEFMVPSDAVQPLSERWRSPIF